MKENFKIFVKNNPKLIDYVKESNKSWQELYEIYSLYGENEEIWDNYLKDNNTGINELVKMIQKVNLDSVKNTIDSLQKAIGIIQNISGNKKEDEIYEKSKEYKDLDD